MGRVGDVESAGAAAGRDLQFIRISGTVVGAGIGLILRAIAVSVS